MASKGVNKVIIIGNLGKDPEVKYLQNGTAAAKFSVATSESWKDKNTGQQKEETEWHNVSILGKLAEIAGEYLKKGSKVYIEGKLKTRKWKDQQGNDKYMTEINLSSPGSVLQMLDSKDSSGQQQAPQQRAPQQQAPQQGGYQQAPQAAQQQAPQQQMKQQAPQAAQQQVPQAELDSWDQDIPF